MGRSTPNHFVRFVTYRKNLIGTNIHGDNRWFIDDNSAFSHVDKRIRGTQINTEINGKFTEYAVSKIAHSSLLTFHHYLNVKNYVFGQILAVHHKKSSSYF